MRNPVATIGVAVALCLIVCGVLSAAERSATPSVTYTLLRSGSSLGTHESKESCDIALQAQRQIDATRTSGQIRYVCRTDDAVTVQYGPNPTCPALPAPQGRVVDCPAGFTGAYTQTLSYTRAPYPTCAIPGEWAPAEPPAGICVPVPPPEPEDLPAPANVRAQGISTSAIRVTWDAVTGASAYSLERCIGATCTTFSQLLCVTGTSGNHSSLPANLTARYRVRGSRDAACGTAAGNLGEYSTIVSGTTLSAPAPTPVNCAVSAWSAWGAGAWSTCSGGQQSRTETRTRTVTTQPANGGTACPALTETRTATQACSLPPTGTALLFWTPPTTNNDGGTLTNLAGYRISYGSTADALVHTVQVANPGVSNYTIRDLAPGTWYFAVRAYRSDDAASDLSNIASKVVQ